MSEAVIEIQIQIDREDQNEPGAPCKDIRRRIARRKGLYLLLRFKYVSDCVVLDLPHTVVDQAVLDYVLLVSELVRTFV